MNTSRKPRGAWIGCAAVLAVSVVSAIGIAAPQQPTFRTGVDLITVDVQVVSADGAPVAGLGPERFEVSINGRRRRVISAELVRYDGPARTPPPASATPPAPPAASGRVYILAIDTFSFQPAATRDVIAAARTFLAALQPNDLVGLAAYPMGPTVNPTTSHSAIDRELQNVVGQAEQPGGNRFQLNPSDIVDLTVNRGPDDPEILRKVEEVCTLDREPDQCRLHVVSEAKTLAMFDEAQSGQRIGALRSMLSSLAENPRRKTIVLVSTGMATTDRPGARPDLEDLGLVIGQDAASANSTIYTLFVDSRRSIMASAAGRRNPRPYDNHARDSALQSRALDQIVAASGGALFTVAQGGGEFAFNRILAETSAAYLLGVEPEPSDRDGRARQLRVRVNTGQRGTAVRARSWVVVPRQDENVAQAPAEPKAAVPAASASQDESPRLLTPEPTPEDVAAYKRLWGGPETSTPSGTPASPAATPASRAAEAAPLESMPATVAAARSVSPTAFDGLYTEYASGNAAILSERLRTRDDFERFRPDMVSTMARWRTEWAPSRAAFALDIAITAFMRGWPDPRSFLKVASDIVTARPDPPGTVPADDAFELLFHKTAIALLAGLNAPRDVLSYLEAIRERVVTAADGGEGARMADPRLILARAMAHEVQTLPIALAARRDDDDLRSWVVAEGSRDARRRLQNVLELLDAAAQYTATRTEASVRRAFILHRLGDHANALAVLDAIGPVPDQTVDYWSSLVRGRVLTSLERLPDAVGAYERAAAIVPGAQTPAVALAALQLRIGNHESALRWAALARSTREDQIDPWPHYWAGDSRFLAAWLAQLRGTRP